MSTGNQQAAPFVFPPSPQDAQITFTITVEDPPSRERGEEVPGEGLLMSAVLEPGGRLLDHDTVKQLFDEATSDLVAGEYVFEASNRGELLIKSPSAVSQDDGSTLVLKILPRLMGWRGQLVSALESFPSAQTVDAVARDAVGLITVGSLKRLALTDEPVADARHAEIVGVGCVSCDFGRVLRLQKLLHALLGAKSPARNEDSRRLYAGSGLSLHRTYGFDSERLSRRVLELETEAREAFAGSAVEDSDDDGEPSADFTLNEQPD